MDTYKDHIGLELFNAGVITLGECRAYYDFPEKMPSWTCDADGLNAKQVDSNLTATGVRDGVR